MSSERAAKALSLSAPPAAARALLAVLARLDHGQLCFTAPDGSQRVFRGRHPGPQADLELADWDVAGALLRAADVGLAECYRDGRLMTSDLTGLLLLCAANEAALGQRFYAQPLVSFALRLRHLLRTNTRAQARRNIAAHYDLSNDFYGLWLDPSMTYSAACFDGEPGRGLEDAQAAKYQRMIELIDPHPGQHVLEVGCGWGGFAEYAARHHDLRVTGITLSPAQLGFARARIAAAGLEDRVRLELIDYRDLTGRYDHIVSIEMFEAVGERYWRRYFETLAARLAPGGRAAVQAITIAPEVFPRYRSTSDFIREFIFPGGMLAPEQRMVDDAARAGLACAARHRFGIDYATTLVLWRERVQAASSAIRALGFDERFLRLWQFYLCYCEAGFRSGRTDVVQFGFHHAA
ncbi:MAG: cyclopropane-fatty-acyl-phospholipid synthase family protein [Gammaproteobacteria bacterium]|nr:cyclopropane-fatty-acyl-phospholipid synthase family protein [Gammaproteobacteria bacterium]